MLSSVVESSEVRPVLPLHYCHTLMIILHTAQTIVTWDIVEVCCPTVLKASEGLRYISLFRQLTARHLDVYYRLCGKFKLVSCERLEFRDQGLRDNVALLTVLQPRVSPRSATATAAASSSVAKVPPHSDAAATPVMTPVHSATATVAPLLHGAAPTSAVPATRCTQAASGSGVSATSAPNGRQHKGLAAEAGGCSSAVAANGFHAASASTPAPEGGSPAAVVNGGARPEATRGRAEGYNGAGDGLADRSAAVSLPPIVVANTHILFNPARGDIKVGRALSTSSEASSEASRTCTRIRARMSEYRQYPTGRVSTFVKLRRRHALVCHTKCQTQCCVLLHINGICFTT